MGIDKRNIDIDELSKDSPGPARPSGTGTHAAHRREADADSDAPMTEAQAEHLQILCEETGAPFDPWLTRPAAERRIRALQRRAGYKP